MKLLKCSKCGVSKSIESFYKSSRKRGFEFWCKECKYTKYLLTSKNKCFCGEEKHKNAKQCRKCMSKNYNGVGHHSYKNGRHYSNGYIYLLDNSHPNRNSKNRIAEHIVVLENSIGRLLLPHENVHHKNGIRDDNRIENLELWTISQPKGQRVEDKIEWALNFLTEQGIIRDGIVSHNKPD